jgi:hypothetical protein
MKFIMIKKFFLLKIFYKMNTKQKILVKYKYFLLICFTVIIFLLISYNDRSTEFLSSNKYQLIIEHNNKLSKCNQTVFER